MKITGNEPAMPTHGGYMESGDYDDPRNQTLRGGLTIRQQFAMAAMQGVVSNSSIRVTNESLSVLAVSLADQLIAELNKEV